KQPLWVPDSEAPNCMNCQVKFTFTKRRHHCRACGKVFCGGCCKQKYKLQFLEKEARVCTGCLDFFKAQTFEKMSSTDPEPSSTTSCELSAAESPTREAQAPNIFATPPSPMAQLQRPRIEDVCPRKEKKKITFVSYPSDAKTEDARRLPSTAQRLPPNAAKPKADNVSTNVNPKPVQKVNLVTRMKKLPSSFSSSGAPQAVARPVKAAQKHTKKQHPTAEAASTSYSSVPQAAGVTSPSPSRYRKLCGVEKCVSKAISLVRDGDQLPPLLLAVREKGKDPLVDKQPSRQRVIFLLVEGSPYPVTFILNANLLVNVKRMTYCSVKCWYFSTTGLHGLGQAEVIVLLQCLPEEEMFPSDMLKLFIDIYKGAMNGNLIKNMGNITFTEEFFGTEDWGGFLFVSPTFQKFDEQILPDKPYLCGILIHKLEVPWLKVFPSRLLLSLGAEFGMLPVPLLSVRKRKPVFTELGFTVFQVLGVSKRNDQLTVNTIDNLFVHLEDNRCCVKIPLRKYNEVMKVINSSDEYAITIGATPSNEADSFLACVQDDSGIYQTKTVSVTRSRGTVTSASFVMFKELTALSRLSAKYCTIEDGIIVQVTREILQSLREALTDKKDYKITCSKTNSKVKKFIDIFWVRDEDQTNKRIFSPVDGLPMEGTLSENMFQAGNFEGTEKALNCAGVYYFVNNYELTNPALRLLAEEIAAGCSTALCPHLNSLKDSGMNKISIRISVAADTVEYTAGSECCLLPKRYLNKLDSTLVPAIHSRMSDPASLPLKLELVFFIVERL
ncbi:Zinc finger FYVE domain-containing protein 16, partial [Dryobates pubescens]